MSLPASYYTLYVQLCTTGEVPVGSGICVDGRFIVTCAHVVNAAARLPLTSPGKPSDNFLVKFPQNTQLLGQSFPARLLAWGWNKVADNRSSAHIPVGLLIEHDLAVLELQADESIIDPLARAGRELTFLKGDLNEALLQALFFDPDQPAIIGYITGTLGIEDKATGTTVMLPDKSPKSFFFEAGSSGSPVWATVRLSDGSTLSGIAGFANFLNRRDRNSPYDARMLHTGRVERLWSEMLPTPKWRVYDADVRRIQIKRNVLTNKLISERGVTGKEIFCDRIDQLEAIHLRQQQDPNRARLFFLYGSERQKLEAFVDRYRYEFMATLGIESRHSFLKMPKEKDLYLFANKLVGNFCRANHLFPTTLVDVLRCTLPELLDMLLVNQETDHVIDLKMENEDFSPLQLPGMTWLLQQFLKPVYDGTENSVRLHVFISFYFHPGSDHSHNLEQLLRLFGDLAIPALENVPRLLVEEWLDEVEGADVERKNRIRQAYPVKDDYDMAEIIEHYKRAIFNLDKI